MERETLMQRDGILVGIAGFSLVNGMHVSPWFDPVYILLRPFTPTLIVSSPLLTFYFTSLFLGVMSVALAGVPAAIFERMTGRKESDTTSLLIWLAFVLMLAIPALLFHT
jgi:hypothetical protein